MNRKQKRRQQIRRQHHQVHTSINTWIKNYQPGITPTYRLYDDEDDQEPESVVSAGTYACVIGGLLAAALILVGLLKLGAGG